MKHHAVSLMFYSLIHSKYYKRKHALFQMSFSWQLCLKRNSVYQKQIKENGSTMAVVKNNKKKTAYSHTSSSVRL